MLGENLSHALLSLLILYQLPDQVRCASSWLACALGCRRTLRDYFDCLLDPCRLARKALRTAARSKREEKQRQEKIADKELTANVAVTDQRETTVKTDLVCDGETLAKTTSKHKQTIFERNGATNDPFLRGVVAQTGARIRGNAKAG